MSPRIKKLIGAVITLLWLVVYVAIAGAVGVRLAHAMPDSQIVRFLYYAIAGTLWIVPIGLMFPWMYREPR